MKKGFTLVELLVSISIITILSTIGVQTFYTAQKRARLEEDVAKVVQALRKAQNSALSPSRSSATGINSNENLCAIGVKITASDKKIQPIYQTGTTSCSGEKNYGISTQLNYTNIGNADKTITFDIPFADTTGGSVQLSLDGVSPKTITVNSEGLIKVE